MDLSVSQDFLISNHYLMCKTWLSYVWGWSNRLPVVFRFSLFSFKRHPVERELMYSCFFSIHLCKVQNIKWCLVGGSWDFSFKGNTSKWFSVCFCYFHVRLFFFRCMLQMKIWQKGRWSNKYSGVTMNCRGNPATHSADCRLGTFIYNRRCSAELCVFKVSANDLTCFYGFVLVCLCVVFSDNRPARIEM